MNLIKATGVKIFLGLIISSAFSYLIQLILNTEIHSTVFNMLIDVIGMCFIFDLLICLGLYDFNTKGWIDISSKIWRNLLYVSILVMFFPLVVYLINKQFGEQFMPWGLGISLLILNTFITYRYLILPKLDTDFFDLKKPASKSAPSTKTAK